MRPCRVKGCVAFGADAPNRASDIYREGICRVHQSLPPAELRLLLKRDAGLVAPLQRLNVGIEYERADGTCYGYDHDGKYYDVKPIFPRTGGGHPRC